MADKTKALRHIAFIMDGNGRWAKKRLMPREYGHKVGAETFKNIVKYCRNLDIEAVGPMFESNDIFPERTNTEFVEILDKNRLINKLFE